MAAGAEKIASTPAIRRIAIIAGLWIAFIGAIQLFSFGFALIIGAEPRLIPTFAIVVLFIPAHYLTGKIMNRKK